MTIKKHHPTDATVPRPVKPPRFAPVKSPLDLAEQAIALWTPQYGRDLEAIARRAKLPRELIRAAAARMNAAVLEDENRRLVVENRRLVDANKRLRARLANRSASPARDETVARYSAVTRSYWHSA